jgi:O-antigen/teichoic acid export membrane protein
MKFSRPRLLKDSLATVGAYGVMQALRIATTILLTRLLAPELFGIMVIVNTWRSGVELMSDVGLGPNIIYNKNAELPEFYNTAWSLQIIRGFIIWFASCAAAIPLANFYRVPMLDIIIPVASFVLVLSGFTSVSLHLLKKKMLIFRYNAFEIITALIYSVAQIALAYLFPTIWALVFGILFGSAATMIGSYFLLAKLRLRFTISRRYVFEILTTGRWIFLSTFFSFLSMNYDRIYLASVIPLALLGIYSIAKNLSDFLSALVSRLTGIVVFPLIASLSSMSRSDLRSELSPNRLFFLLSAALVFSLSAAILDLVIKFLFDQRYQAAGWMLPILLAGAWFSIMCSLNEAPLFAFGKMHYSAIGNSVKFGALLFGIPIGYSQYGTVGAIAAIAISEIFRYSAVLIGQFRQKFSFGTQDLIATLFLIGSLALLEWLRWSFGYGTSFDELFEIAK